MAEKVESLEQAKAIINEQDRMIGELTRRINSLEDSERRRNEWLRKAKKEAGYTNDHSFDTVWAETLAKAQQLTA